MSLLLYNKLRNHIIAEGTLYVMKYTDLHKDVQLCLMCSAMRSGYVHVRRYISPRSTIFKEVAAFGDHVPSETDKIGEGTVVPYRK